MDDSPGISAASESEAVKTSRPHFKLHVPKPTRKYAKVGIMGDAEEGLQHHNQQIRASNDEITSSNYVADKANGSDGMQAHSCHHASGVELLPATPTNGSLPPQENELEGLPTVDKYDKVGLAGFVFFTAAAFACCTWDRISRKWLHPRGRCFRLQLLHRIRLPDEQLHQGIRGIFCRSAPYADATTDGRAT